MNEIERSEAIDRVQDIKTKLCTKCFSTHEYLSINSLLRPYSGKRWREINLDFVRFRKHTFFKEIRRLKTVYYLQDTERSYLQNVFPHEIINNNHYESFVIIIMWNKMERN